MPIKHIQPAEQPTAAAARPNQSSFLGSFLKSRHFYSCTLALIGALLMTDAEVTRWKAEETGTFGLDKKDVFKYVTKTKEVPEVGNTCRQELLDSSVFV